MAVSKLEALRGAVKEATDSIDRREGIEFKTVDDLAVYIHQIGKEISAELAAKARTQSTFFAFFTIAATFDGICPKSSRPTQTRKIPRRIATTTASVRSPTPSFS